MFQTAYDKVEIVGLVLEIIHNYCVNSAINEIVSPLICLLLSIIISDMFEAWHNA